jgi:DNA-binding MarR family transcriptional regulator
VKTKKETYAFSKQEIRIAKEIASDNLGLSQIRERLSIKPNLLSYYLKKLQEKRIIKISKTRFSAEKDSIRSRKNVFFQDTKHASLLKELLAKYPHIKWEEILSGQGIEVLFQILDGSATFKKVVSPITFWRYSKSFMALGIVTKDREIWQINERFSLLRDFLDEYQSFLIKTLMESVSSKAIMLWHKDFEFLIRVPKKTLVSQKGFTKTATSRLPDFGIQLISDFDIYFYSKTRTEVRLEDVILHTLLVERGGVRYATYSLLLLKKEQNIIDKDYLLKIATWYDLSEQINAMLEFLRTKGARTLSGLPTWDEFIAKMSEYDIEAVA